MIVKLFADQCHNASTENLCRCYKNLRRKEVEIQTQLEVIRQELTQRGFLLSKEEIENIWRENNASK